MISAIESSYRVQASPTQNDLLEAYLRRRPYQWISMPDLAEAIGAYAVHSRIADLRKRGMTIDHVNDWRVIDGRRICCSRYRFVPSEIQPSLL